MTGTVDVQTPGTYTLKYNATDLAGNAATEIVRTVVVTAGTSSGGGIITEEATDQLQLHLLPRRHLLQSSLLQLRVWNWR